MNDCLKAHWHGVTGLGWVRIEIYIYVKKLLFRRTISVLKDGSICNIVAASRANSFNENIAQGMLNVHQSPIFDILKIVLLFDLYDECMRMLKGLVYYSKCQLRMFYGKKLGICRVTTGLLVELCIRPPRI